MSQQPDHNIHVVPRGDLKEHIERVDCWCQPIVQKAEVGDLLVITHHSLDGRELVEEHGVN